MQPQNKFDVCVIGAGVAGGVLAAYLSTKGMSVCVIEKTLKEQERIVGELLQPGGLMQLKSMGLAHLTEGFDAQPIFGYGLFMNGDSFRISYSKTPQNAVYGYGFRNHKFVEKIRHHLRTLESVCLVEGNVTNLIEKNGRVAGVKYLDKETEIEKTVFASVTVASDGMFSAFRAQLSQNEKRVSSYFLGLILHDCPLPYNNHGHVVISKPSPCLLYPISATETRILIDFPQEEAPRKSNELSAFLTSTIAPQLPELVRDSFLYAVAEGKIKVMPNHYVPAKPIRKPGAVLIGDSLNMRHPLTGGGMTVAFTDIHLLGNLLEGKRNDQEFDEAINRFYSARHNKTSTINILADALYGVMKNDDLKNACYQYLKRGGSYAEEPISLLAAINSNKKLLLRHFFAVAMYGVKNTMLPFPRRATINQSRKMITNAVEIVSPLVLNENPDVFTRYAFKTVKKVLS